MTVQLDVEDVVDLWALRVVVREGTFMRLNRQELVMACHLLREKGFTRLEIQERLRETDTMVDKYLTLTPVIPVGEVDPTIVGPTVVRPPSFSRKLIQPGRKGK